MTHLTEVEIVDWLDGALTPARAAHVDECETCGMTAARMRETVARAADVAMPEPSPLFWEHFSARVHEGVRHAEADPASRWLGWAQNATVRWAMCGALLTLLVVGGVWRATAPLSHTRAPLASAAATLRAADVDIAASDIDADEAWAIVRTVADDLSWDEAAVEGVGVRQGSIENAMATLTGDERSELVRLLEAEIKQPGA